MVCISLAARISTPPRVPHTSRAPEDMRHGDHDIVITPPTDLVHGGVLVEAVDVPRHCVDHPHAVQVGEGPLAPAQSAGQQLDDAPDVRGVAKLDHVETSVGQEDLEG